MVNRILQTYHSNNITNIKIFPTSVTSHCLLTIINASLYVIQFAVANRRLSNYMNNTTNLFFLT